MELQERLRHDGATFAGLTQESQRQRDGASLIIRFVLFVFLLAFSPAKADSILVSGASSLTDVLIEAGKAYESRIGNRVSFNFAASSELARQIDEGAPADVFFSADLEKMQALEGKNLIDPGSRRDLLSNLLVLVTPIDSKLTIRSTADFLRREVKRIALAEPSSVPAGIYAKKYLETEGIWEKVKNKVVPAQNVRATLAVVETGNVDVGIVYKTDAAISRRVKVVYEIPPDRAPKIIYPVAVVKESRKKAAARDFLEFLLSDAVKTIYRNFGFVVLE